LLPLLYLHGQGSGDFVPALGQFLGSAAGLCLLVMIGVRADGRKELIALPDGYRESANRG